MAQSQSQKTKLKLEYPGEFEGAVITELQVRRPKGRDMRFLPSSENAGVEDMYPFLALLAGIDERILDEMDAVDITALSDLVTGFLSSKSGRRRSGR